MLLTLYREYFPWAVQVIHLLRVIWSNFHSFYYFHILSHETTWAYLSLSFLSCTIRFFCIYLHYYVTILYVDWSVSIFYGKKDQKTDLIFFIVCRFYICYTCFLSWIVLLVIDLVLFKSYIIRTSTIAYQLFKDSAILMGRNCRPSLKALVIICWIFIGVFTITVSIGGFVRQGKNGRYVKIPRKFQEFFKKNCSFDKFFFLFFWNFLRSCHLSYNYELYFWYLPMILCVTWNLLFYIFIIKRGNSSNQKGNHGNQVNNWFWKAGMMY